MAFRFTLPSTYACHYLELAIGIFFFCRASHNGCDTSTGNYCLPTASISENIIDFPGVIHFFDGNWLSEICSGNNIMEIAFFYGICRDVIWSAFMCHCEAVGRHPYFRRCCILCLYRHKLSVDGSSRSSVIKFHDLCIPRNVYCI